MTCSRRNLRFLISHRPSPLDYSTTSTPPLTQTRLLPHTGSQKVTKLDDALQLFDEMLHKKPPPSVIEFTKLINNIVKIKHYSTALSLLKQINFIGIPCDIYAINISINCYCRLKQVNYSFALLATIFKLGHPPDLATYNTLIHGLVLADRVFEAVELFKKLIRDKLCEPNQVMYGTVIKGLCKVDHTSKALELLRFMEKGSCRPFVEQYNAI
ncbi:putative tetratricopeptide-like helical domain superfamily protein, partial [Tanacetum coccineum]